MDLIGCCAACLGWGSFGGVGLGGVGGCGEVSGAVIMVVKRSLVMIGFFGVVFCVFLAELVDFFWLV